MGEGEVGGHQNRQSLWCWWQERVLPSDQEGVGADAKDGLGDLKVKVVRVDMTIAEALQVANAFTDEFGIGKEKF